MHGVNQTYTNLYNGTHIVETKVEIYNYIHPVVRRNGVSFARIVTAGTTPVCTIPDTNIISLETHRSLFDKDDFSIGCCVSGEIDFEFYPVRDENDSVITIPTAAMLCPYIRLYNPITNTTSDWVQKGVYFIDTRDDNYSDGRLKIHGFDAMDKLNLNLTTPSVTTSTNNRSAIRSIAINMGIANTSLLKIPSATLSQAQVDVINSGELKSFLCGIAAENCANFCIDEEGTLIAISAIPKTSGSVSAVITESNTESLSTGEEKTFTTVTVIDKDGAEHTSSPSLGDDGLELVVEIPWGTDQIALNIRTALSGFTYKPYTAEKVALDPKYELGDEINVLDSTNRNRIFRQDLVFDHLMACDIEAPYDKTATSEAVSAVGLFSRLNRTGADYITSTGTNGIWTYELWNSGKVIANCSYNSNISVTQQYGAFYCSADIQFNLPIGVFGVEPKCQMSVSKTSGHDAFIVSVDDITSTDTPKFKIVSPTSWTDYVTIDFYLIGEQ